MVLSLYKQVTKPNQAQIHINAKIKTKMKQHAVNSSPPGQMGVLLN